MEILIGREENSNRLLLAVQVDGQMKLATTGSPNSVPKSVSRCKPQEGSGHCKIEVDAFGTMTITNLRQGNTTCVEGMGITKKRITPKSNITLGRDAYVLNMEAVQKAVACLDPAAAPKPAVSASSPKPAAAQHTQKPAAKECDIRRLERVWRQYETSQDSLVQAREKKARNRMIPMLLGGASGVISTALSAIPDVNAKIVTIPIAILSFVFMLIFMLRKDDAHGDQKQLQNWLYENYTCPNTGKFIGNTPYKLLQQQDVCPHCKGKRKV